MKRSHALFPLLFLLCAASAHAQLFKSVGPDGKVTYSDTPPPSSVKRIETKALGGGSGGVELPYEVAEAVKNNPVVLYTGSKCAPCDDGRKMLTARGIPFTEKTVTSNDDIAHLRQIGGSSSILPLLIVGRNKQQGFEAGAWGSALTAASYPETSKLPNTYRNPPPEAAVPLAKPVAGKPADNEPPVSKSDDVPPATGNAPPGFRF
jgi:hypothetical protein